MMNRLMQRVEWSARRCHGMGERRIPRGTSQVGSLPEIRPVLPVVAPRLTARPRTSRRCRAPHLRV